MTEWKEKGRIGKEEKKRKHKIEYPIIDIKRTGFNLKRICEDRKISAVELQNFLGLSCPQTVYRWFSGQAIPSVDNLFALGKLLELPIEKLLVRKLFLNKNSLYILMTEATVVKGWEFTMRILCYQNRRREII